MSKRTFIVFGVLVAVLAVLIPWYAFRSSADPARHAEKQKVVADLDHGQSLFKTNCGNCHTLYAAGTDGNFGPDLDMLLAEAGTPSDEKDLKTTEGRVLNAIVEGVSSTTTPGRMPPGILTGEQAEEVAKFVAHTAGRG